MNILACFDGSPASESALAQTAKFARVGDEVILFSVVEPPEAHYRIRGSMRRLVAISTPRSSELIPIPEPERRAPETESQAHDRDVASRLEYLKSLQVRLPVGATAACEVVAHPDAATAIIERGLVRRPDLIIMATHGRTGLVHILFGDVAEEVVRSGVAPVLLVHPETVRTARRAARVDSPGGR